MLGDQDKPVRCSSSLWSTPEGADMNAARVRGTYKRQSGKVKSAIYDVELTDIELNDLVELKFLDDDQTQDKAAVGKAIENVLKITLRNRKKS